MNLLKLLFRDKQKQSVNVAECWEVRWYSRHGHCEVPDLQPEVRVFTNQQDAENFKKALRDAFKLLKYTSGNLVELSKQKI